MTTYKETQMSQEFKVIEIEQLTDKHIVIIEVDVGNLPAPKAREHIHEVLEQFRSIIPATTNIVALPKGKIDVRIIEKDVE